MDKVTSISALLLLLYSGTITSQFISNPNIENGNFRIQPCTLGDIKTSVINFNTCLYKEYQLRILKQEFITTESIAGNLRNCFIEFCQLRCQIKQWIVFEYALKNMLPAIRSFSDNSYQRTLSDNRRNELQRCLNQINYSNIQPCLPPLYSYISQNTYSKDTSLIYFSHARACITMVYKSCPSLLKNIIIELVMSIGQTQLYLDPLYYNPVYINQQISSNLGNFFGISPLFLYNFFHEKATSIRQQEIFSRLLERLAFGLFKNFNNSPHPPISFTRNLNGTSLTRKSILFPPSFYKLLYQYVKSKWPNHFEPTHEEIIFNHPMKTALENWLSTMKTTSSTMNHDKILDIYSKNKFSSITTKENETEDSMIIQNDGIKRNKEMAQSLITETAETQKEEKRAEKLTTTTVESTTEGEEMAEPVITETAETQKEEKRAEELTTTALESTTESVEMAEPVITETAETQKEEKRAEELTTTTVESTTEGEEMAEPVITETAETQKEEKRAEELTTTTVESTTEGEEMAEPVITETAETQKEEKRAEELTTTALESTTESVEMAEPVITETAKSQKEEKRAEELTTTTVESTTEGEEMAEPVITETAETQKEEKRAEELTTTTVESTTEGEEMAEPVITETAETQKEEKRAEELTTTTVESTTESEEMAEPVITETAETQKEEKRAEELTTTT
ncbi:FK506-binding protein 5-like [Centruroides vittatus]|uniref:FK506-binding protein 5-like n=1 Tax=Centruroides vittatus TaxID=120091 RepID=UPI00350EA652